jgi:hypothetical protein
MHASRVILVVSVAIIAASAPVPAQDDPSADLQQVKKQLVDRLSPTESALLERINTLEDKLQKANPWLNPPVIIAITVATAGWAIALFQFFGNRQQRIWELLLESLRWFEGGTQARSIGIALVESKWQHHEEFRSRWTSILMNQAIYLLTRKKERDAIHERANLYRIMNLLIETVDPSGHIADFDRELLRTTLEEYDPESGRGLIGLDTNCLNTWVHHFGGTKTFP